MFCRSSLWVIAGMSALLGACAADETSSTAAQATRGATYTTFPAGSDACNPGSENGINCNHYVCEDLVYVSGGPNRPVTANTLENGEYFFAVLAPGHQNGGAADGSEGNLSDTYAFPGTTDNGSGDAWTERRFRMNGGVLTNLGSHPVAMSPNGQPIVRVSPFDVTPNPGGVYILAICPVRDGVPLADPAGCKFDAFKTERCDHPPPPECDEKCHDGDVGCVPCPQVCDPNCLPTPQITITHVVSQDAGSCIPCDPVACDPWCSPNYPDCIPCI